MIFLENLLIAAFMISVVFFVLLCLYLFIRFSSFVINGFAKK